MLNTFEIIENFKQFRTNTVVLWFFSNFLLVYIFTNTTVQRKINPGNGVNPYLGFLLWSVAFLSLVRFVCSTIYLIGWAREWAEDANKRTITTSAA